MNIELKKITVKELTEDYEDNEENGVLGYGGKLDIRPPYQREFVYGDNERDAVIDTLRKDFPLNVMYWAVRKDGNYEVIDGQQRTISICQYVNGDFAYLFKYFHNLQQDEKEQILNYELMVYICSGEDSEKLKWFETINIAGKELTKQELKNAVYSGSWVTDAKRYFSRNGNPAQAIGSDYLNGKANRQDYLETAIKWISNGNIDVYMANHQHDPNALALWQYFQSVITWVQGTFVKKRTKFMKGVDWGSLYNEFKDEVFDTQAIENETANLIADDDVERKKGIYPYILTRDERYLGIRTFTDSMKQKVYEKQKGICLICKNHFDISEMEGDHITPWHEGGKTIEENCQMLCKDDNRRKSGK
ncbi:HNH endonuclease family protein [Geojedonia litorea]|uniref:HNH endonuclease family protein n=1 Tax=Geojedonia litorea TaxID=1268269 RepID=A0ABV9N0H9_9FLAO